MERNPFAPEFEKLPELLPLFPLTGAFLLPMGHLPLNVFEPRYMRMVEDALAGSRMIGIIQPLTGAGGERAPRLHRTGCAGKIVEFSETADGRYLIKLAGLYRFNIETEIAAPAPYRVARADWRPFRDDGRAFRCLDLDRARLNALLRLYFSRQQMNCDWEAVDGAPDGRLITCLAMICPFEPGERQALLEAACCRTRAELFMRMLEIAAHGQPPEGRH